MQLFAKLQSVGAVIKSPVPRPIVSARRGYSSKRVDTCSAAFDSISVAAIGASAPGCQYFFAAAVAFFTDPWLLLLPTSIAAVNALL